MMPPRITVLLIGAMMAADAGAQDSLLTLDEAIARALEKDFDIRVARNTREQAANNDAPGEAGMLPRIDLNGSYTRTAGSARQELANGTEVDRANASSDNLNANVALSWTVFDGMRMFATREKLGELAAQGDQALKIQVENTTAAVIAAYYEIVQQQQVLRSLDRQIAAGEEAVNISGRKFANGSGSKLDLLLARTDLNALRSQQLTTRALIDRARIGLCELMAVDPATSYAVEDTVVITYDPTIEELQRQAGAQNSLLVLYDREQRIAELGLREYKADRAPVIDLTGAYQFARSTSDASFISLNRSLGYTYGITATVPLFDGSRISRRIRNAELDLESARIRYDQVTNALAADVYTAYQVFQAAKGVMRLEEEDIVAAREVLSIASERYRVGVSTIIEFKEAQATYGQAVRRLAAARNAAKLAETELQRLAGVLVR